MRTDSVAKVWINISDVGADPLSLNCPVGRGGNVEQRHFLPFSCYLAVSIRTSEKSEHEQLVDSNSVFSLAPNECTSAFAHRSDHVIKLQE